MNLDFRSSSGRCASSRHLAEGHPQVLIIAPYEWWNWHDEYGNAQLAGELRVT
jgi:hypothetical protein